MLSIELGAPLFYGTQCILRAHLLPIPETLTKLAELFDLESQKPGTATATTTATQLKIQNIQFEL